jgi:Xaa-Pro aminopeptidase
MEWAERIQDVQKHLIDGGIDGWLLYDFHGINTLAREFLKGNNEAMITRRYFYWIPARGEPIKILHRIEPHVLTHLPGKAKSYLRWEELGTQLGGILKGAKTVAMEFSPNNAIPYLSKVDGGTVDLIRSFGVDVVSSGSFLQYYMCVLSDEQVGLHREAAAFLDTLAAQVWEKIAQGVRSGKVWNEHQVRMFMADQMATHGFVTEGLPICAVNAHSADPHYEPLKQGSSEIKKGDFVLIDLWCKKAHPQGVYADISRVAVIDAHPSPKQLEIFSLVRMAQKAATDFVVQRYARGDKLIGAEVDQVCRRKIEEAGYGEFFIHRTGHNIYTKDHGPGAHLDSVETLDQRELIAGTCFSIEPGIYLPGEFGVRLEYDLYLGKGGRAEITGGIQDHLIPR